MGLITRFLVLLLPVALAACVVAPPLGPPEVPLVAVPGPTKTEAQFRQDDATCRAASVELPPGDADGPAAAANPAPRASAGGAAAGAADGRAAAATQQAPPTAAPPGVTYLRCMEVRNNLIEPLVPDGPPLYGYYAAYPVWASFGDPYPWYYGNYVSFGFYGGRWYGRGWYGGRYYGGRYYGGYGGRWGDGWRGGWAGGRYGGGGGFGPGFRGDGFRGGGFGGDGFRGGGFRGDGFRGDGFRGGGFGGDGFRGGGFGGGRGGRR